MALGLHILANTSSLSPHFDLSIGMDKQSEYWCTQGGCNREFTSKRNFVDHCRGHHQGKKPHTCEWIGCGKSFLRPAHLLIHTRIHTGEKPFVCSYEGCGKKWNQKSALKQHMRSHTGEKPFQCSVNGCDKRFSTSSSCKRHVLTHENAKGSSRGSSRMSSGSSPSSPSSAVSSPLPSPPASPRGSSRKRSFDSVEGFFSLYSPSKKFALRDGEGEPSPIITNEQMDPPKMGLPFILN